ncbi:Rieske domain-containing protein-like [Ciona intestinalis]
MSQESGASKVIQRKNKLNQQQAKPKVWQYVGYKSILETATCQRLYSINGKRDDISLFYVHGNFYAINATCPHAGGPLDVIVDLEDLVKREEPHVICPWHHFSFNLLTGKAEEGLQAETYQVKVDGEKVYVFHSYKLSVKPFETEI